MSAFHLDSLLTLILTQVQIPFRSSQSLPDVKFKQSSPAFVAYVLLGTTSNHALIDRDNYSNLSFEVRYECL